MNTDSTTLISVIIPVYNKQDYIRDCLDSVTASSFPALEIICADDGSTDASLQILNEYRQKDSRIKVLALEHNCAGAARNAGLEAAQGVYVHFLDADDRIAAPDVYEKWYLAAEETQADLCECLYTNTDAETGLIHSEPDYGERAYSTVPQTVDLSSDTESLIKGHVVPWNKLIRRSFLLEKGIRFMELSCAEDRPFYYELIYRSRKTVRTADRLIIHLVNISTSLDGSDIRFRDYDVEFRSFEAIWETVKDAPQKQKLMVLDSCIGDSMFYLQKAAGTPYEAAMKHQAYTYWRTWIPLLGEGLYRTNWFIKYLEISAENPQEYKALIQKWNSVPVVLMRLRRKLHRWIHHL